MRTWTAVTFTLATLVALLGCNEQNPLDPGNGLDTLSASLRLVVLQQIDNQAAQGAQVDLIGFETQETDSTGMVAFAPLRHGNYLYRVTKSGYAPVMGEIDTDLRPEGNTQQVEVVKTAIVKLYRTGVEVHGHVTYKDGASPKPASDAIVELAMPETFVDYLLTATADSEGRFEFSGLPERTEFSLTVRRFVVDQVQYRSTATRVVTPQALGDTAFLAAFRLEKTAREPLVIMHDNADSLGEGDSVVITFSEPIDTSEIDRTTFSLYNQDMEIILISVTWSKDRTTVRIAPHMGKFEPGETYWLAIQDLVSQSGDVQDFGIGPMSQRAPLGDVTIVEAYEQVYADDTLKIDWSSDTVTLVWNELPGAATYAVFASMPKHRNWIELDRGITDTLEAVQTPGFFESRDSVLFMVLGENPVNGTSDPASAMPYVAKDQQRPLIYFPYSMTSSYSWFQGCNNLNQTTTDSIKKSVKIHRRQHSSSLYRSEPLDTNFTPSFSVKEGGLYSSIISQWLGDTTYVLPHENVSWQWISDYKGVMTVTVPPSVNAAYDTIVADFRGITDLVGNVADTTDGSGIIMFITRN